MGIGTQWGVSFEYVVQEQPNGIAQALILARGVSRRRALGADSRRQYFLWRESHRAAAVGVRQRESGATVFGYYVQDPERYGVVQFDAHGRVTDLLEKPARPPSNYAVTGIYFYDARASAFAKSLGARPRAANSRSRT